MKVNPNDGHVFEFQREIDYIKNVCKLTYRERTSKCNQIFDLFTRICVYTDIADDIYQVEGLALPYCLCFLSLRTFLEFQATLLEGAYYTAGRSLRWLFETNLAGSAASLNPSLLDRDYEEFESIDLHDFLDWLEKKEERTTNLNRKNILEFFNLEYEKYQELYSSLCAYSHISIKSFDLALNFPKLQFLPEKFDEIFNYTMEIYDLIFYLQSQILLEYNHGTKKALQGYLRNKDGLNIHFPLTISLIKKATTDNK